MSDQESSAMEKETPPESDNRHIKPDEEVMAEPAVSADIVLEPQREAPASKREKVERACMMPQSIAVPRMMPESIVGISACMMPESIAVSRMMPESIVEIRPEKPMEAMMEQAIAIPASYVRRLRVPIEEDCRPLQDMVVASKVAAPHDLLRVKTRPEDVVDKRKMEEHERAAEEESINNIINGGKVIELRDKIQPWKLAKCTTNSLILALETSSKLRGLAKKKPSEGQELEKLGDYIESFACALVEPFEEDEQLGSQMGNRAVDTIIETSIACKQKKFLSNPVIYNFMIKKWYGKYFRLAKAKHGFLDYCWWIFLHLWSVADIVLFPLVLLLLYTVKKCNRKRPRRTRSRDVFEVKMMDLGEDGEDGGEPARMLPDDKVEELGKEPKTFVL